MSASVQQQIVAAPRENMPAAARSATRQRWLPRALLLAGSAIIFVALAALTALSLRQGHHDALSSAATTTLNLTRTLEEQALGMARLIDYELMILTHAAVSDPDEPAQSDEALRALLRSEMIAGGPVRDLAILDATGRLRADATGEAPKDLAERGLFAMEGHEGAEELLVSAPFPWRGNTDWTLAFGRRVADAPGGFAGMVVAFVELDRMQRFYASLDVGAGGAVTLWNGDATRILARYPENIALLNRKITVGPLYEALHDGKERGLFSSISPVDGIDRLVSFRRVAELPLVVSVALDMKETMASWRRDLWVYGGGFAIAALVLLALTFVLYRQLARGDALVAALSRSEAATARINRRFEDAIESLTASFSIFDGEDRFVIGNREHRGMGHVTPGLPFATVAERAAHNLIDLREHGGDAESWIRWRLERHRRPAGPLEIRYRNGNWDRVEETRMRDGGTVVVRTDITALKELEAAIRRSEERFRDYAETASDWYWETDAEHRFTYLSERVAAYGIDPARAIGHTLLVVALATDPDEAKRREYLACLERREPFADFIHRMGSETGAPRWGCTSGKPVFDADGDFRGYRGTGRDVTAQMLAQADLREAKRAAEAANRAKSEFLAAMSHELRTPLNAIIGFSEMIRSQRFARDARRVMSYAGDIHASGEHLLKVINDILEVSRIEAGRLGLREEDTDLWQLAESSLTLVDQRALESGVMMQIEPALYRPRLRVDPTRVKQILLNLLSNAVKFTPRGGMVAIGIAAADGGVDLRVCDTGIGMSPDEITIALQPFGQVDSSLSRRFEGTGLGLPLAKAFAELHGGGLRVESKPGKGTSVTVRFPRERILAVAGAASIV